jgi:hypothetical protein
LLLFITNGFALIGVSEDEQSGEHGAERMRTVIILLGGFFLLAACVGIGRVLSRPGRSSVRSAMLVFMTLWFLLAAANLYVGVWKAGYGFFEELPIFLIIFVPPAALAGYVGWKRR